MSNQFINHYIKQARKEVGQREGKDSVGAQQLWKSLTFAWSRLPLTKRNERTSKLHSTDDDHSKALTINRPRWKGASCVPSEFQNSVALRWAKGYYTFIQWALLVSFLKSNYYACFAKETFMRPCISSLYISIRNSSFFFFFWQVNNKDKHTVTHTHIHTIVICWLFLFGESFNFREGVWKWWYKWLKWGGFHFAIKGCSHIDKRQQIGCSYWNIQCDANFSAIHPWCIYCYLKVYWID